MKFEEEDMALILMNSIPESYDNLVTTLMWGNEILKLEEITCVLLAFNQRKKATDGSSQGKRLVAKGNQERGRNKSQSELSRNKSRFKSRRRKDIQCNKCGKGVHKTRMSIMEEREHKNQGGFIKVYECSRRRRLRER